jgi:hypothetical protein
MGLSSTLGPALDQAAGQLLSTVPRLPTLLAKSLPSFAFFTLCFCLAAVGSGVLSATYRSMTSGMKSYWAASVVSTLHASIVVVLAIEALLSGQFYSKDLFYTTPASDTVVHIFWGYILYDILLAFYYVKEWTDGSFVTPNIIHHMACLITYGQFSAYGIGHLFALMGAFVEVTTPFVNLRWFLEKTDLKGGSLYFYNGVTMAVLWLLARVVGMGSSGFDLWGHRGDFNKMHLVQATTLVVAFVVGYSLQLFWFYKIVKGALKVLSGPTTPSKKSK